MYGQKFAIRCKDIKEANQIGYDLNSLIGIKYLRVSHTLSKGREMMTASECREKFRI